MSDMMSVRVRSTNPVGQGVMVEDAETGKQLPILIDDFSIGFEHGLLVIRGILIVDEIDLTGQGCFKQVTLSQCQTADEVPSETVDDFAARTVSLIMEPKCQD
jgi:hypothetical protein